MKIGIVGIGLMGHAFAQRLIDRGYKINIYNRSVSKTEDLTKQGATLAVSVEDLVASSDTILLMLSDADVIRKVLPGGDALDGKTIMQMATISPDQSRSLQGRVIDSGGSYVEAPVLGSIPEAKTGTLIIMVGASEADYLRVGPLLQELGSSIRHVGDVGLGSALKLAMNQLIVSLTAAFSMSLSFALVNKVDVDDFMDTVRESALYAKTYDKKLDKYLSREFGEANCSTKHLLKDIRLFMDDAHRLGIDIDMLKGVERIMSKAVNGGLSEEDYSSIYKVISPDT